MAINPADAEQARASASRPKDNEGRARRLDVVYGELRKAYELACSDGEKRRLGKLMNEAADRLSVYSTKVYQKHPF